MPRPQPRHPPYPEGGGSVFARLFAVTAHGSKSGVRWRSLAVARGISGSTGRWNQPRVVSTDSSDSRASARGWAAWLRIIPHESPLSHFPLATGSVGEAFGVTGT